MTESFRNIEDEPFPSFLSSSLSSSAGTLGNVTLGSTLGLPVAASTVAKIRAGADSRAPDVQASYLEDGPLSLSNSQSSNGNKRRFSLGFKDDLGDADSFIAAHRISDALVKVQLDDTQPACEAEPPGRSAWRNSEHGAELSTGLITHLQLGTKIMAKKPTSAVPKTIVEEHLASEGADSDNCSASLSSFLENEKLMSLDSMNSDSMDDDDIDVAELPDSELEQYFKTLVPPAMQRGQVEGQEIPAAELNGNQENESLPSSPDQEKNRCQFLDDYEQDDFQMPHIRLAATGMDSCPASDEEDTEDELEAALRCSAPRRAFLLSSTTRQLVGESNHPSFRPGLEGGSSDDETPVRARNLAMNSGIEFRRSAEGQVISSPVTGGGGDGSSGSDKEGSDGGVSTVPLFSNNAQTSSYDVLRGLGIVGGNGAEDEADDEPLPLQLASGELVPRHSEMGDRVGPVGTGEAGSSTTGLVLSAAFPFQRTTSLDRQEALGAMDSAEAAALANGNLDSLYLRIAPRPSVPPDQSDTFLEEAPGSFHLSQVVVPPHGAEGEALGLRGGPCGDSPAPEPRTDSPSEEEEEHLPAAGCRPSLEAKYLSQTFPMEDSDDGWSNCPDSTAPDLNPEGNEKHDVVYQNEEGKWVTDLAYYSCFEKELEANGLENAAEQFQSEDFISASNALEKIAEAEEEFEKEHRFMQEEQMVAQSASLGLGDTSWRLPSRNSILMRASQVSSEFEHSNQSYLRLSLGQFFGQRSEALGCLGVEGQDDVKRPSFGYVITSPEKREPFALIRPSGFSSQGSPGSDDALTFSDADETMNPEDLDRTLEAETSAAVPEAEVRKESLQKDNQDLQPNTPSNQKTCKGNGGSSHEDFMLSISTIASAIADASVSSDPAQLAAMIMQLSKKNQSKKSQTGVQGRAVHSQSEQNSLLEALQKSTSAGELSVLDIEKYLKKTEIPGSDTEAETRSVSPYSFDSPDWADGAGVPLTLWDSFPPADSGGASRVKEGVCTSACDGKDNTADWGSNADNSSTTKLSVPSLGASVTGSAGSARKEIAQRSALPRPKTSYAPVGSSAGSERSVSAGHACGTAVEGIPAFNVGGLQRPIRGSTVKKPGNSGLIKDNGKSGTKLGKVRPNVSSSEMTSLQALGASGLKAEEPGCALPAPRYPPGQRSPPSGLPSNKSAKAGPRGPSDAGESPPKMKTAVKSPAGKGGGGAEKRVSFVGPSPSPVAPSQNRDDAVRSRSPEQASKCPEESHMTFRPSTSPLTHSSPSQTSSQGAEGSGGASPLPRAGAPGQCACGQLSPQSSCSSPSLSRLTYISVSDSTLQNSTSIPSPEKNKTNSSIALSTTIVRASPTPPVQQGVPGGAELVPASRARSVGALGPRPRSSGDDRRRAAADPGESRSRSECGAYPACGGGSASGPGSQTRRSEPAASRAAQTDSGYSTAASIQPQLSADQSSQQWKHAGDPAPASVFAGSHRHFGSEDQRYVPISSFKPQGSVQDLPPAVPTLLTGRSLFTSQIAQQYLGTDIPLHLYHVGPAAGLYGVPPSLAGTSNPVGHVQGSGPLGVQVSTHLLNPVQLYRTPSSLEPPLISAAKPYTSHNDLGALDLWAGGGLADVQARVVVPEELKFPHACCVGIASQTSLSIFNPTERWLQVNMAPTSLSIDGEKVESLPYQLLIVKNKTIIGPRTSEEQKVLFIPLQAGVYHCVLSVSSWPVSAESGTVAQAEAFAQKVVLMAMAETPLLEVYVGPAGVLDFGDLTSGSVKALPLKLINRTHATVPVRLVISTNATAWRCFTFSKSPVAAQAEGVLQAGSVSPLAAPSVMSHVMHANYGENPETFLVWVHFRAPQKYVSSSGELGPAEEYAARVDIEVDSPGPSHVIRSVPLRARSGTARVHAPKDLQTVHLLAAFGKTVQQTLPLKNAGNINVHLKIKCTDSEDCFSVKPEELHLHAGDEQGLVISFTARGSSKYRESVLTILVLPTGPQYEVMLKGELAPEVAEKSLSSGKPLSANPVLPSEVPPILSNKQFMAWGGVTLGRAVQQKLVLRNNSSSSVQQLRLLIRGQDQDCFQLQSTFGPEERLTNHRELAIRPREDASIHLLFAPTRVACMLAKLEIKQSGMRSSQPGIKFTIPLSGYGGTSNIILEEVKKLSESYVVTLPGIAPGQVSKLTFCMRNTGSRAAFVKAVAFADLQTRTLMDSAVISISPAQFVLKERTQEVITLLCKSTRREQALCQSSSSVLSTVYFFCGDEISRQQLRRFLCNKPEVGRRVLSENSLLKNINFNERFLREEQVTEVYDLPERPNDAQLFYGSMNKVILSVLGSSEAPDCTESHQPSPRRSSEADSGFGSSDRHIGNVSLDVLPVKGPQGPPLALNVPDPALSTSCEPPDTWSVVPEQLVLTAPTINCAADTGHVKIMNKSPRVLGFELSWPAHCLTITPQHGLIEPESHLQILISPNPSLATKSSILPWSGKIYIQCDNQQKFVKVQIREGLALDLSATASSAKPLGVLTAQPETPVLHVAKPQPKALPTKVEIKNRTLVFPTTVSGESSESCLEVENSGEEEVRWYLSSFAPPYVKGVDNSGDVYRATYTAFRCSRVSGTLGSQEKLKVPVSFLPRDRGDYAQFWDLECHPVAEPHMKQRIRFQLCGTGVKDGATAGQKKKTDPENTLIRTETTVKVRKRSGSDASAVKPGGEEATRRGVYAPQDLYAFPLTKVGESSTLKVNVRNSSFATHVLKFISPREPFHIKHSKYSLRSQHYINLPVQFKPGAAGNFATLLLIQTGACGSLAIQLTGEAVENV
ncbi:centrosomal protein of 192 kDa [Lepisosteus oculatus]|uniref:centrosomal protein of 192 kDa n=1 Tax=Lepisosteus oculatus TaxID=7918 RepID=UPI0035F5139A